MNPSSPTEAGLGAAPSDPSHVALEVYRAMWADLVIAARVSDYRSPLLARHATAQAVALMTESVLDNWRQGAVMEGQPSEAPVLVSLTPPARPTSAVIDDCVNESSWITDLPRPGGGSQVPGPKVHASAVVLRELVPENGAVGTVAWPAMVWKA
jgi:hypothetical protein